LNEETVNSEVKVDLTARNIKGKHTRSITNDTEIVSSSAPNFAANSEEDEEEAFDAEVTFESADVLAGRNSKEKKLQLGNMFSKRKKDSKNAKSASGVSASDDHSTETMTSAESGNEMATFEIAQAHYDTKDYASAQKLFAKVYQKTKKSRALYFQGMSTYKMGNLNGALKTFDQLVDKKLAYSDNAKLMKAVIFLRQGKVEEHAQLLKELEKSGLNLNDTLKN